MSFTRFVGKYASFCLLLAVLFELFSLLFRDMTFGEFCTRTSIVFVFGLLFGYIFHKADADNRE
jgi:hypothetical protein